MKRLLTAFIAASFIFSTQNVFAGTVHKETYSGDLTYDLSKFLDNSEYGGMYSVDGIIHIKLFPDDTKMMKSINSFTKQAGYGYLEDLAVIEYDAVYSLYDLDRSLDKLWEANYEGLIDIYGAGIDDSTNGLSIDAEEWTDEKKALAAEITGIDIDHIEFGPTAETADIETILEEPPKFDGFTKNEYAANAYIKRATIKTMRQATISYGDRSVDCDVFSYYGVIYVPLRNVAELTGHSIVYDSNTKAAVITDIVPENPSAGVAFGRKWVGAEFNKIQAVYKETNFTSVMSDSKSVPDGFNCEGHIYVPIRKLTNIFGLLRYYDENGNIIIFEESGRLKQADKEVYDDYFYQEEKAATPSVDQALLEEAKLIILSGRGDYDIMEKCEAGTVSINGKPYISVSFVSVTPAPYTGRPDTLSNTVLFEIL